MACGLLDVGDARGYISTDEKPAEDVARALRQAQASDTYDGPGLDPYHTSVARGLHTVAKAQHRDHERYGTVLWFDGVRTRTGLPAPRLLDLGKVGTGSGELWWAVLERVHADEVVAPSPAQQRTLGAALRRWHETAPEHGLRLDEPGALGVFLGTPRRCLRAEAYVALGDALAHVCLGQPMVPIHGDVAAAHNAFFRGDELAAVIDPGAVHVGPPMLDLAWCLAIDGVHGAEPDPLLDGYGRDAVDADALEALLPIAQLRYLVDVLIADQTAEIVRLMDELSRRAPDLLRATGAAMYEGA